MSYIYHEKQDSLLCGQHCLNNLLQGPYFNAVDLSDIAIELDQQERNLLEKTTTLSSSSDNVDESGNFSIQVLNFALQRFNNISLHPIHPSNMATNFDPLHESGFIFNISSHWFTIRKINNNWWNLNSTNQNGPQFISPFYLSAYIHELIKEGYSIFIVKGEIPTSCNPSLFRDSIQDRSNWYIEAELLNQSLHRNTNNTNNNTPATIAFSGKGQRLGGDNKSSDDSSQVVVNHSEFMLSGEQDEDILLAQAISASLESSLSHSNNNNDNTTSDKPVMTAKEEMRMKRLLALDKKT